MTKNTIKMKKQLLILFMPLLFIGMACDDDEFLNKEPKDILLYDQVWSDEGLVLSVLAELYGRFPDYQTIENWVEFTNFDEAFASAFGDYGRHHNQDWGYQDWEYWDYGYIREINLFIEKAEEADQLPEAARSRFLAEARFLRAGVYFELVKRMGGVPIVLEPLTYDYSGNPDYLQFPRAKEHEVYDFVINELDEIKNVLPDDPMTKSRASKGAALAMQMRAALYAGSIAKYGANTPEVSLPGGEVGIPASMATGYYQKVMTAFNEMSGYSLYDRTPDRSENFSNIFLDKNNNPEVIFVEDYKLQSGKVHGFTISNQPRYQSEEQEGGRLNPSLNLVQSFERLDNTFGKLSVRTGDDSDFIYYDDPSDLFENRDPRLSGTVILPGTTFKDTDVEIWAGFYLGNDTYVTGNQFGAKGTLPGLDEEVQIVGYSGPIDNLEFSAQTGFYIRKFLDPTPGSGQRGVQSEVWWVRYRYSEVLLNAAEASFELGNAPAAVNYMNQVRSRAGLTTPLTVADITFDRIVHERKVELAFEGHQLWDMKRWRLAHIVWDGSNAPLTENPGNAEEASTRPYGLWPYQVHNPGDENHGKWVFKEVIPSQVRNPDRFRLGNYYSRITDNNMNRNPELVKNPNQ
jgi:hypothetical protein